MSRALFVLLVTMGCETATEPALAPSRSEEPTAPAASAASSPAAETCSLHVADMTCEGCAWQIRDSLEKQAGVIAVHTSVADKSVRVEFDPGRTDPAGLERALGEVGYEARLVPR